MPVQNRALKPDKTASQSLAAAPLSYTTDYGRRFKLESVSIHVSVPVTEIITVTLDSAHGVNYDAILSRTELDAEQDFVFRPQGELNLQIGDEIKVECTNANITGTAYAVIKASEITQ